MVQWKYNERNRGRGEGNEGERGESEGIGGMEEIIMIYLQENPLLLLIKKMCRQNGKN
jgi:hypothetical protein